MAWTVWHWRRSYCRYELCASRLFVQSLNDSNPTEILVEAKAWRMFVVHNASNNVMKVTGPVRTRCWKVLSVDALGGYCWVNVKSFRINGFKGCRPLHARAADSGIDPLRKILIFDCFAYTSQPCLFSGKCITNLKSLGPKLFRLDILILKPGRSADVIGAFSRNAFTRIRFSRIRMTWDVLNCYDRQTLPTLLA